MKMDNLIENKLILLRIELILPPIQQLLTYMV